MESEPPREIRDNPEMMLVWNGLKVSIEAEQMTRKQAFEFVTGRTQMLSDFSHDDWWVAGEGYELPRFGWENLGDQF